MIDHTGIRVADVEKSKSFYAQALAPLGYAIRHQFPGAAGFGVAEGHGRTLDPGGDFWLVQAEPYVRVRPVDGTPVTVLTAAEGYGWPAEVRLPAC